MYYSAIYVESLGKPRTDLVWVVCQFLAGGDGKTTDRLSIGHLSVSGRWRLAELADGPTVYVTCICSVSSANPVAVTLVTRSYPSAAKN